MQILRSSVAALALLAGAVLWLAPAGAAPAAPSVPASFGTGPGTISGTVSDDAGGPATGVHVRLWDRSTAAWVPFAKTTTDPGGHYTLAGVDLGSYNVRFGPTTIDGDPPGGPYVLAWNGGATGWQVGPPLVISGADHLVADATLAHGGTISGRVLRSAGSPPILPMTVRFYEDATGAVWKVKTGSGGRYTIGSLPSGSYHLRVGDGIYVPPVWFGGTPDRASSTPVVVTAGDVVHANVVVPGTGSPAPDQWVVEPSVDRLGGDNSLTSTSCPTIDWCMAVGSSHAGVEQGLAEVWEGGAWTLVDVPRAGDETELLRAVSCASPTSCMAVGGSFVDGVQRTFAVRWDGTGWTHTPTPNLSGYDHFLQGVSCPTSDWCVAVGTAYGDDRFPSVMAIWEGATWRLVPGDDRGSWDGPIGVSCSSPTWCVAVGDLQGGDGTNGAEVQAWDGTAWSAMPGPPAPPGFYLALTGVTCRSETSCVAVGLQFDGRAYTAVVETWDGTAWTLAIAPPGPSGVEVSLRGVSCPTPTRCAAVGYASLGPMGRPVPLIVSWDGASWSLVPSPVPWAYGAGLRGVSCVSGTTVCRAVGWSDENGLATLVMRPPAG